MIIETLIYISIFLGLFTVIFYLLSFFSVPEKKFKKIPDSKLPRVAIIVPAWNEEKGIVKTILSLKEMDYPKNKLEIIVVDDGSTDKTYEFAKPYENSYIKVFKKKENGGKFTALNYGIAKAKADIIVSTDGDNLEVMPDALKKMVKYFEDNQVMCVAPAMAISNPKGVLARIQQIEYLLGVFLRKAFASLNAIHVTPGAFSAYKKSFILETGGFKKAHLTEDMEMALRIQKEGYRIENAVDAIIYTVCPTKFVPLLKQRRRWYTGLIRNFIDYKTLFSPRYGIMGVLVLPMATWAIFTSIVFTIYIIVRTLDRIYHRFILLSTINFNIFPLQLNSPLSDQSIFNLLSNPLLIFTFLFLIILVGYMFYAKMWVKKHNKVKFSIILFFIVYSFLSCIWWIDAIIYSTIKYKKLKWR